MRASFFVLVLVSVSLFAIIATAVGCQKEAKSPVESSSEETEQTEDEQTMDKEMGGDGKTEENMAEMKGLNEQQMAGLEVYNTKGCSACHTIDGEGGDIGPELSGTGEMHTREELEKQIRTPREKMPKIEMTETEIENLVEYLKTLKAEMEEEGH